MQNFLIKFLSARVNPIRLKTDRQIDYLHHTMGLRMSNLRLKQQRFAALDIGSSKVCFVIGQVSEQEELSLTGLGEVAHTGMSKGVLIHIDATIKAIARAKQEAEIMAAVRWTRYGFQYVESIFVLLLLRE